MSGIPSRPIPPPRAPRNCKPPIPKRPDRIRATSGNLPFISQPRSTAVNNGMNEAADAAEATDGTNSCSTTRLAPIVESPDKVASLATLQPPRPIPRYSPTSPPVPQKPKRLSSYCSEGLTSTSSGCSATQLVAPKSDSTELIHALDTANDSQFAVVRSASPLPPPKPLRFSMTPSNDSTNSLNSLPSPASLQRTSSASFNDYSTPSDVLPESLNRSTFASRHRDDRSPSAEKSPTFTEPCPNLLSKGNSCFSCDSSNSPDEPTLPLPKIRHYATSSTSTDEPTGSVLDEVVRHESSSINIYPDLNATTSATTPSLKLIDFSSESEMSIPVKNGQSNGTENEAHDGTQCRLSPTIATKSHYANLPLVHDSVGSKESCHCIGPPEVHPPSPPPPPIPPQHYGLMRSIVDKQDEKKQQLPGLEVGPNGGIWNPGYIGLENYRKLVEASQTYMPINRSAINVEVSATSSSMCEMSEADMEPQEPIVNELVGQLESNAEEVAEGEAICFSGYVHLMFNKKDRGRLWAVLRSNRLTFHQSEDQVDSVQHGPYEAGMIIYVGCSPHSRSVINICLKENALCLHWNYLKLTAEEECSNHWVLLLAKCVMPKDDTLTYSVRNVDAAGRVWIRQGATCPWSKGWMHLDNRRLLYILDNCAMLFELDVRKFIAMKTEVAKVDWCASVVGSQKGPFLLTQDGSSLYVQGECDSVTTLWAEVISSEMECTGSKLEDHKLTADDVPIIVDKCIKFISTYGLYQPGLYRRNGSTVEARLLMEELKRDPINVHIAPTSDETINVVADVLRSFFRQLESPLVPYFMQQRLFAIAEIKDASKLDEYHEVLMSLPRVRLQTLRRLLDHLKDVTEHANANLASVENIAKAEEGKEFQGYDTMIHQVNVLKDLILNYTIIFRVSLREMHAKSKMDMLQSKANSAKARADGFLVPIHLFEKDSHTFNVQSSHTAEQVCEAARNRPCFRDEGCTGNFALFEVIKCGQLQRRVGLREKMSSMVTGRWLDWDPTDCFLLFKRDPQPFSFDQLYPFADDVKIAEPGSKSFSTGHLKLETGTTIVHYNKSMKQLNEWHVDDILWFLDNETGRKPPTAYTLTFVLAKKNFKFKSKFIGYCVAFREDSLRIRWLNAVLSSQVDFQASPAPLLQI